MEYHPAFGVVEAYVAGKEVLGQVTGQSADLQPPFEGAVEPMLDLPAQAVPPDLRARSPDERQHAADQDESQHVGRNPERMAGNM